ncbi:hypothetical protein FRZ32_03245 [Sphingosinicella ginsenosidimutans]|uniref:Uncharacterized protein n=1 Tax=Allosphingosinicella ginsenosidimutans TaxID=1176539 RepID=A0A5C6TQM6_9SPHN|nr:hypothetical protein FRZ32_03245 [Sphingosinicella ginsenosidimutans]
MRRRPDRCPPRHRRSRRNPLRRRRAVHRRRASRPWRNDSGGRPRPKSCPCPRLRRSPRSCPASVLPFSG